MQAAPWRRGPQTRPRNRPSQIAAGVVMGKPVGHDQRRSGFPCGIDRSGHVLRRGHRAVANADDDVAGPEAAFLGHAARHETRDEDAMAPNGRDQR